MLKDLDIRKALHATEISRLCVADPTSRVVDELGIFEGACRIDVAVINGALHGYEIKSSLDTLDRLPSQQSYYNRVFDRITLVADGCHIKKAMEIVPPSWGLIVADNVNGQAVLNEIWPARKNYLVDAYCLCQLLWRDEALSLLRRQKMASGMWNKPRKTMWRKLAKDVPIDRLSELVRETLKSRSNWRT